MPGDAPPAERDERDSRSAALGHEDEAKCGLLRATALTFERRREIAQKAIAAWRAKAKADPEPGNS